MPVVSALAIVSCLYAPLVCFYVTIKTVKNILFAYCVLLLVCGNRARFIYASKNFYLLIVCNLKFSKIIPI